MTKLLAAAALFLGYAFPVGATEVSVSMMYSNATSGAQPYVLFEGKEWRAQPRARFVKLHVYFDEPVALSGFELVACKPDAALSELSYFINFDEFLYQNAAGQAQAKEDSQREERLQEQREKAGLNKPGEGKRVRDFGDDDDYVVSKGKARFEVRIVRSLTINFERTRGVRLCGLTMIDAENKPVKVRVPRIVAGSVTASSTLDPADAYAAPNLFDSRFEYAWATNKASRGVTLDFAFAQPASIARLMVWNGYQRSPSHCFQNSRARTLRIESDAGESAQVELRDVLGSQVVALSKPLRGTKFRFTVDEAYTGSVYQDLAISELRFGDEAGWYLIDAAEHGRAIAAKNLRAFAGAGLGQLLDDGYYDGGMVKLRLRSDGSFYLSSGFVDKQDKDKQFFTLGSYEILQGAKKGTLRLRLFGVYREERVYGDCNGCGWDCNVKDAEGRMRGRIFQQNVILEAPGLRSHITLRTDGARRLPLTEGGIGPEP